MPIIASSLATGGLPATLADIDSTDPDRSIVYSAARSFRVATRLLADAPPTQTPGLHELIRDAATLRDDDRLVVVAHPHAWARLNEMLPSLAGAIVGDRLSIDAALANQAGVAVVPGDLPDDIAVCVVALEATTSGTRVLLFGSDK